MSLPRTEEILPCVNVRGEVGYLQAFAWGILLSAAFFLPFVPLIPGRDELLPGLSLWDWQRLFQGAAILLGLACFIGLLVSKRIGELTISRRMLVAWLLGSLIALFSAVLAGKPQAALLDWAWFEALVVFMVMASGLFASAGRAGRIPVLGCAGAAALLYVFWFFVLNTDYLFSYDFRFMNPSVPGFSNPRFFSDFQAVLLFLVLPAWTVFLSKSSVRWLGLGLIGLLFSLAFQMGGRSVILGQLIAHGGLFLFLGRRYLPDFRRIVLCWFAGFLFYVVIFEVYAPWAQSDRESGVDKAASTYLTPLATATARIDGSGRGELLVKAWRLVTAHPFLGVGGRHYGCFVKDDFHDPNNRFNGDAAHPHNMLAQFLVEWGAGVALLVTGGLAWLLYGIGKRLRDTTNDAVFQAGSFDAAMAGGLFALLAHALVNGVVNAPVSQMLLVLLLGWGIAFAYGGSDWRAANWLRIFLVIVAAAIAVTVAKLLVDEVSMLPAQNEAYSKDKSPTWYLAPRFWQQGWLLPLCGRI